MKTRETQKHQKRTKFIKSNHHQCHGFTDQIFLVCYDTKLYALENLISLSCGFCGIRKGADKNMTGTRGAAVAAFLAILTLS